MMVSLVLVLLITVGKVSSFDVDQSKSKTQPKIPEVKKLPEKTILPDLLKKLTDCSENIIDFEDLETGTKVFNQYGEMGVIFPHVPRIIEVEDLDTIFGIKAVSSYYPGLEFGNKLVIEFTSGQNCISLNAGLLEDTNGNKVMATLEAYNTKKIEVISGVGMKVIPEKKIASVQRQIGPGPENIKTKMTVLAENDEEIYRVELTYQGGYFSVVDDLRFSTIGEPYPVSNTYPQVNIDIPFDDQYITGFTSQPGAIDIMGTINDQYKLKEVTISVSQGQQNRRGYLSFSGTSPDYTFGGQNIHNLIFPGENQITITAESFSGNSRSQIIQVYYDPLMSGTEAELLILTPGDFYKSLEPLRNWKNSTGVSTHIMTLKTIEQGSRFDYNVSRDLPEQIKKDIAYAYNHHNTRYVMLVGDGDSFPVRYHKTGREDISWGVVYAITDLYYACLFKSDGTFDNWDGNNNNIIGEWWSPPEEGLLSEDFAEINIDNCNLKPDVAVGRIPASNAQEVENYVSKVIEYEMEEIEAWTTWLDYILLWNSFEDSFNDDLELDYIANELLYKSQFEPPWFKKRYRPEEFLSWSKDQKNQFIREWKQSIIDDINEGVGLAIFFGHGSRLSLGILDDSTVSQFQNKGKYPIFITSACDTAKFVQEWDIYMDVNGNYPPCWPDCEQEGWQDPRPEPAPIQPATIDVESMAEVLLLTPEAGGVGFLGSHMGTNQAGHPLVKLFITAWNHDNVEYLGDMWTFAIQEFVEKYLEVNSESYYNFEFYKSVFQSHHIHKFILFGDPSLRIKNY